MSVNLHNEKELLSKNWLDELENIMVNELLSSEIENLFSEDNINKLEQEKNK